jgi:hypothetical protein
VEAQPSGAQSEKHICHVPATSDEPVSGLVVEERREEWRDKLVDEIHI